MSLVPTSLNEDAKLESDEDDKPSRTLGNLHVWGKEYHRYLVTKKTTHATVAESGLLLTKLM